MEDSEDFPETIKVGLFHFPPFTFESKSANDDVDYSGVEVTLVRTVAESLGLRLSFHNPSDGGSWGSIDPHNGSSTGLIHDIIYGKVDVGMAEFFIKPDKNLVSDPSDFYTFDHFCFVRSILPPAPHWLNLVRPFTPGVWVALALSIAMAVFFLSFYAKLTGTINYDRIGLTSLAFFVNQETSINRSYLGAKIFFATLSVLGTVLSISYGGTLASFLSVTLYPRPDHSIESLLSFPGTLGTISKGSLFATIAGSADPKIRRLADKFEVIRDWQEGMDRAAAGTYAYMSSKIAAEYVIQDQYTESDGVSDLYVMSECWSYFPIVLYFPKTRWRLRAAFDDRIRRLRESGLVDHWLWRELGRAAEKRTVPQAKTETLSLDEHLKEVFLMLLIGLSLCCTLFGAEVVLARGGRVLKSSCWQRSYHHGLH